MKHFTLLITILFITTTAHAQIMSQELIDNCINRRNPKMAQTETTCDTYGNQTKCVSTSQESGHDSYDIYLAQECAKEISEARKQKIDQLWSDSQRDIKEVVKKVHNIPLGKLIKWQTANTKVIGTITATRTGTTSNGLPCRRYKVTSLLLGEWHTKYINACKDPQGNWDTADF